MARALDYNQHTIDRFHETNGRDVPPWGEHLLLLTTRGEKTGEEVTTPTVRRMDGGRYVIVASKGGYPEHPQWYRNLQKNPEVTIEVPTDDGTEVLRAMATPLLEGPERDRLYAYMAEVWPAFIDYEKKTDRKIPIVVLEPVGGADV
jgi:deazaflavin-dependent oxidoreductase (nitroreductase family)